MTSTPASDASFLMAASLSLPNGSESHSKVSRVIFHSCGKKECVTTTLCCKWMNMYIQQNKNVLNMSEFFMANRNLFLMNAITNTIQSNKVLSTAVSYQTFFISLLSLCRSRFAIHIIFHFGTNKRSPPPIIHLAETINSYESQL